MPLTARLALSQLKNQKNRSFMTTLGIVLSSGMLTALWGFVASAQATLERALGYDASSGGYNAALWALGAVLGAVVVAASVIVVSNAFRISAGERTRQFGQLKSAGATKRQIAATVLYEAVFLSALGIPLGILMGLLLEWIGTGILTGMLRSLFESGVLNVDSQEFLRLTFTLSPMMFVAAVGLSAGTVMLSAWLPARKAARIPAIEAIRAAGEVALEGRGLKTWGLSQRVFGFEGALAAKSLRRSRRAFRATVLSLTVSIVLVIAAGSFGTLMIKTTNLVFPGLDATALVQWHSDLAYTYDENGENGENGEAAALDFIPLDAETAEAAAVKFRAYPGAEVYGVGGISRYSALLPDGRAVSGALITLDSRHYAELCGKAGVPLGSSLLVNLRRAVADGKRTESKPYHLADLQKQPIPFTLDGANFTDIVIDGELTGQAVPGEVLYTFEAELMVILPACPSLTYHWYTDVADVAGFAAYAQGVVDAALPQSAGGRTAGGEVLDIAASTGQLKAMAHTILVFVYGFVGMLALIAVTNVVSTISSNIRARAREFAVLKSVGMTERGVQKMLNLESVLCSARALMYGLPLGVLAAYLLYRAMGLAAELPFTFPWLSAAECVAGVFLLTWAAMRHAASRMRNGNLAESIRGEGV
jgi:putative ABC transport system permease protein